ncbi:hypothetical protein HKD21_13775 [Gluconobacter cerevisiae]|uniref:Glycosyl transferase n=1 Tax=Gluconobacter cerevisiae TaxID=1379734 RepID=A0ABR9YGV1_9PROT|nr:hypothetical protein [Gluconobacter cerevisiae]MBF0877896.1 hypothetical protein [Gluconobacter cerevisiae]
MTVYCFTSATYSYLGRVRVLAKSIRRHHPDWVFCLCLCDVPPQGFDPGEDQDLFDEVVPVTELGIPDLPAWMFRHNIVELSTAVKGKMLCRLLEKKDADSVVYIDPDIALFNPLTHVLDLLKEHPVVLTPHQLEPEIHPQGIVDNEIGSLKHGIYNLGFMAIANVAEGQRIARWWRDRLLVYCRDDPENGLFTDQKWCDLIPAFFENSAILRDPGYNVASWNLSHRPIRIDNKGQIYAANAPLRFFHFTKVDTAGEVMLERYGSESIALFELLRWYREAIEKNQPAEVPPRYWYYGTYEDGTQISRPERLIYRDRKDLQIAFPNPYQSGAGSFQDWCVIHSHEL